MTAKNINNKKETLIMLGMLTTLCLLVFHKFIFFSAVYLFKDAGGDTVNYNYPMLVNVANAFRSGAFPSWSFEQGMGQDTFAFSLNDPTNYFLYLLGPEKLKYGIVFVEIFKIICGGSVFFAFLRKQGASVNPSYVGGMLYAFSGFMIVGGTWFVFSTVALYVAFMLLSFEILYQDGKDWLIAIAFALLTALNPFTAYTSGLFLFFYMLFRLNNNGALSIKNLSTILWRVASMALLGAIISAAISMPTLQQMLDSPRVGGDASLNKKLFSESPFKLGDSAYYITLIMRTFSNDLLGNGSLYRGWGNYLEAPLNYCGIITLLLVPQLPAFLTKKQRISHVLLASLFLIALIFPWFRQLVWLFSGDYFRDFSLFTSIILILFSVSALDGVIKKREINLTLLAGTAIALLILLSFPYSFESIKGVWIPLSEGQEIVDGGIQLHIIIYMAIIVFLLSLVASKKYSSYAQIALLVVTFAELLDFSYGTINNREVISATDIKNRAGYNDYTVEALDFIKSQDDGFYRVEKSYSSSPDKLHAFSNDSRVQGFYGVRSYHQFNKLSYINFLSACGALDPTKEAATRWARGLGSPIFLSLVGSKYNIYKDQVELNPLIQSLYEQIFRFENVTVFKYKYALPMGVAYDSYITESDFNKLQQKTKPLMLLYAVMVPDKDVGKFVGLKKISYMFDAPDYKSFEDVFNNLTADKFTLIDFSNTKIEGEITTKSKKILFFSFPFDAGWAAEVNGRPSPIIMVDGGLSAVLVDAGLNRVSLQYIPPMRNVFVYLSLFGLICLGVVVFRDYRRSQLITLATTSSGQL